MAYPTNIGSGRIVGRFIFGVVDGPYDDQEPDYVPAKGSLLFTPSVPYLPNATAVDGPVTIALASVTAVLDAEGYLCTPDPEDPSKAGYRGVRLFANNDPDSAVQNWTWTVTYKLQPIPGSSIAIPSHAISLGIGEEKDLTTAVKVPSSPGVGVPQYEAAVLRAEAAAQSVVDRADAGEFKGDQGDPGNATMRIDNTVGKRVFMTDGTTETMISGDTGWRDLSGLLINGWALGESGKIQIQRAGNLVTLRIMNLVAGSATSASITSRLLSGFFPTNLVVASLASSGDVQIRPYDKDIYRKVSAGNVGSKYGGSETSWITDEPWPTSLPGTPA